MALTLVKRADRYDLISESGTILASTAPITYGKISISNCEELFTRKKNVIEIDVLIEVEEITVIDRDGTMKYRGDLKLDKNGCMILKNKEQ